ncbi:MAG: MarR family transcriptional regulator [Alphaproteobacteria bacterium]|nr:MarR family transcriptional regulator [Alphaproteobacteria bacterium]
MVARTRLASQDDSKARLRFWLHLLKATRHMEAEIKDRLRLEFDTTLPRFDVMAALEKSGAGLKMSQLSKQLMVSNGNVTGIVDRLVTDGLVVRVSIKGDRRATLVRLTLKGETRFSHMARAHQDWVAELLRRVDDTEISLASEVFCKIRDITS